MDPSSPLIWGPALWKLLHFSVERWGSKILQRLPQEEIRLWNGLLHSLRYSLPCPQCKRHYQLYHAQNPLIYTKESLRAWLLRLHGQVNERLGKPEWTGQVEDYQQPFCFSEASRILHDQMISAVRKGWCSREDVIRTIRYLEEMKRFYDFH